MAACRPAFRPRDHPEIQGRPAPVPAAPPVAIVPPAPVLPMTVRRRDGRRFGPAARRVVAAVTDDRGRSHRQRDGHRPRHCSQNLPHAVLLPNLARKAAAGIGSSHPWRRRSSGLTGIPHHWRAVTRFDAAHQQRRLRRRQAGIDCELTAARAKAGLGCGMKSAWWRGVVAVAVAAVAGCGASFAPPPPDTPPDEAIELFVTAVRAARGRGGRRGRRRDPVHEGRRRAQAGRSHVGWRRRRVSHRLEYEGDDGVDRRHRRRRRADLLGQHGWRRARRRRERWAPRRRDAVPAPQPHLGDSRD